MRFRLPMMVLYSFSSRSQPSADKDQRIKEKINGKWMIANLSTYWDYHTFFLQTTSLTFNQ